MAAGTTTTTNGSSLSYVPSPEGTYQPWWDMWFRYYSNAIASRYDATYCVATTNLSYLKLFFA